MYNTLYVKGLLKKGWVPTDETSKKLMMAKGIVLAEPAKPAEKPAEKVASQSATKKPAEKAASQNVTETPVKSESESAEKPAEKAENQDADQ